MIQILFSVLLSLFYCVILSLFIESDINNFVKNLVGKNNTFEFIIFLIFGILNGSISGYIISSTADCLSGGLFCCYQAQIAIYL